MEIVLAIVVLGSLLLNVGLAVQLIRTLKVEEQPIIIQVISPELQQSDEVKVLPEPESVTKKEQPALQAWQNRKDIPWFEDTRPKSEPVRTPQPGPLERPGGFV